MGRGCVGNLRIVHQEYQRSELRNGRGCDSLGDDGGTSS